MPRCSIFCSDTHTKSQCMVARLFFFFNMWASESWFWFFILVDQSLKSYEFLRISKLVHRSFHYKSPFSDATFPYFPQSVHAGINFTVMLLKIQCIIIQTERMFISSKFVFTAIRPLPKMDKRTYFYAWTTADVRRFHITGGTERSAGLDMWWVENQISQVLLYLHSLHLWNKNMATEFC